MMLPTRNPKPQVRKFNAKVGTPRRRGTGVSPSDRFVALRTECSAAERGGNGAARHPYLCFVALRRNSHEISRPGLETPTTQARKPGSKVGDVSAAAGWEMRAIWTRIEKFDRTRILSLRKRRKRRAPGRGLQAASMPAGKRACRSNYAHLYCPALGFTVWILVFLAGSLVTNQRISAAESAQSAAVPLPGKTNGVYQIDLPAALQLAGASQQGNRADRFENHAEGVALRRPWERGSVGASERGSVKRTSLGT
jgi:hypothetical protein